MLRRSADLWPERQPPPQSGLSDDGTRLRNSSGPGYHLDRGDQSHGHSVAGCSRQGSAILRRTEAEQNSRHGHRDQIPQEHGQGRRFRAVPSRRRSTVEFAFERKVLHACSNLGMLARGREILDAPA